MVQSHNNSGKGSTSRRKESRRSTHSSESVNDKNGNNTENKKKKKNAMPKVVQRRDVKSKSKNLVDIFNEYAIVNAYYICHNVQDLLKIRGFPWPELGKKKKKKK